MGLFLVLTAVVSLTIWLVLVFARGAYWQCNEHFVAADEARDLGSWPSVAVIVPARDEADVIERAIGSLLEQDYLGAVEVVCVDDQSQDGTGSLVRSVGERSVGRLRVVRANDRPSGWAPKVWAMQQGLEQLSDSDAAYVWLSDADIEHGPGVLRGLVSKAESERLDQVSTMVRLEIETPLERLLIPAFVLFFAKLYPFAWVNDRDDPTCAAAGGSVLVHRTALTEAGAFESIRSALIDDCSLAARLGVAATKRGRGIWLGTTDDSHSIRAYGGLSGVWKMVARSAYVQLGYSPLLLMGTLVGMILIYLAPPLLVATAPLHGELYAALFAGAAWGLMAWTSLPILRRYRQPLWLGIAMPFAGLLYTAMTVDSAWRHHRGRGSAWKGRALVEGA